MATTMEELEKRVAALERELSTLRREFAIGTPGKVRVESARERAAAAAAWERVKEELGLHGEPIGAEKLRERMLANGVKPEENLLSRGIIEMREEY